MSIAKEMTIWELEVNRTILEIQDGNHGEKHPVSSDYVEAGIPFIMANNIADGRIDLNNCKLISKAQADSLRTGFSQSGDVLLTHKGTVGNVAIVPQVNDYIMLTPQVTYYRVDNNKLSNEYLAYAFRDPWFQIRLHQLSAQSTRPYIGITAQRNLKIRIHPLQVQKRIASILSAYDNLIENNLRRIKILEEMAQNLYREWFVKFRFPSHEKVKFVDSPLGEIPEGWGVLTVTQAIEVNPREKVDKNSEKPYVPMGAIATNSMLIEGIETRTNSSGSKFRNGDTLFARITPCLENGKTAFVQNLNNPDTVAIGSTEFIVLRSKTVTPEYVYLLARSHEFREHAIKSMTGASGRQRVQTSCLNKFLIANPSEKTLSSFSDIVKPMFLLIGDLAESNSNLRQTRNLLLPRLISGELDVSDLDIEIPGDTA